MLEQGQRGDGHLARRIASQTAHVRSYLLKDGRLYLLLMADGGIILWEPIVDLEFEETANQSIEAGTLAALQSYTRSSVGAGDAAAPARYVHGRVDRERNQQEEVLAYTSGREFRGTGVNPVA